MKITIAGGDLRMITVGRLLAEDGFECAGSGVKTKAELLSALKNADAVIFPMPCSKSGFLNAPDLQEKISLDEVISACGEKALIIGGYIPSGYKNVVDYALREELLLKNAVPTAEGAVALAMQELQTTLHGSNALVVGFGRIGSYLASLLKGFGAKTTVVARSLKSRAQAAMLGVDAVGFDEFEASLSNADVVFNTVPFTVIGENELNALRYGVAVIDLASLPGGVDEVAAEKHGAKLIRALALPGKVAPETAGRIIYETVISILRERGLFA